MAAWASRGVTVSAVSDEHQQQMLATLRSGTAGAYEEPPDLCRALSEFISGAQLVAIADWNAEEHPALLLAGREVVRREEDLRRMYPDGFVVWRDSSCLIVDFEDQLGSVQLRRVEDTR